VRASDEEEEEEEVGFEALVAVPSLTKDEFVRFFLTFSHLLPVEKRA